MGRSSLAGATVVATAVVALTACTSSPHGARVGTYTVTGSTAASYPSSTSAAPVTSRPPTRSATPTPHPASTSHPAHTSISVSPTPSLPTFPPGTGPVVVLDAGHNGGSASHLSEINKLVPAGYGRTKPCNTTGTATNAGYPEHAFTWDVTNRVKKILNAHGVRVILTRDSDTGVGPCVNVRAAIESTQGVAAAIAIHADGAPSSGHGFHICEDSRTPVGATAATVAKSQTLSDDLRTSLGNGSGLTRSTYIGGGTAFFHRDDLTGLNLSTNPTTFLELGNMRNSGDAALQTSAAGRARIAAAVAAGILRYLGR